MIKKKANPRKPSDYKTLQIRVPPQIELQKIMKKVEKVRTHLNKSRSPDKKTWMNNHVLLEAIKIGLKSLEGK